MGFIQPLKYQNSNGAARNASYLVGIRMAITNGNVQLESESITTRSALAILWLGAPAIAWVGSIKWDTRWKKGDRNVNPDAGLPRHFHDPENAGDGNNRQALLETGFDDLGYTTRHATGDRWGNWRFFHETNTALSSATNSDPRATGHGYNDNRLTPMPLSITGHASSENFAGQVQWSRKPRRVAQSRWQARHRTNYQQRRRSRGRWRNWRARRPNQLVATWNVVTAITSAMSPLQSPAITGSRRGMVPSDDKDGVLR